MSIPQTEIWNGISKILYVEMMTKVIALIQSEELSK